MHTNQIGLITLQSSHKYRISKFDTLTRQLRKGAFTRLHKGSMLFFLYIIHSNSRVIRSNSLIFRYFRGSCRYRQLLATSVGDSQTLMLQRTAALD